MNNLMYFPIEYDIGGFIFGVSLIIVGAGLMNNGMCGLRWGLSGTKHAATVNFIVAVVLIMHNWPPLLGLANSHAVAFANDVHNWNHYFSNYYYGMLGLFFGCVYLFIGLNAVLKLDPRPYGVFSLGCAAVLAPLVVLDPDWRFKFLWLMWTIILFIIWWEATLGKVFISPKFTYKFCIFLSFTTGYIPGMIMLLGLWYPSYYYPGSFM
ncbi:MAG: hypothetical protein FWE32_10225 [Oscillospiraceae bacterium]|nr:hypothetical protein [Oscillospiraceae bacterium]